MNFHLNIEKFLSKRLIESDRLEFKKGWNPASIYRSICAYANDFENIGGGYILIGVEEENGVAKRPIIGIAPTEIDKIQREMIGFNNLIKPFYAPKLFIEELDNKLFIILWVPGGSSRPYEVPSNITAKEKQYNFYIRRYSNSVIPSHEERLELINLANQTPFDDRPNTSATLNDISPLLIREFLIKTNSKLADSIEDIDRKELFRSLDLISGPDELIFPKNIALLLFNYKPEQFFPRSHIEWVEFPSGPESPEFIERPTINGPIQYQVEQVLNYFKTYILKEKIIKVRNKAEALRVWNYPFAAIEEAIVNAVYHKNYQVREPVEVRIFPNKIEIINYGGLDRSVRIEDLNKGIIRSRRYRNSRIGDFFKELELCEAKGTGIPTIRQQMKINESPPPVFETDENRTYFIITLPINEIYLNERPLVDNVVDNVVDNESIILNLIRQNNEISSTEVAKTMGVSARTAQRYFKTLQNKGIITRVGPDKGGYWQVNIVGGSQRLTR